VHFKFFNIHPDGDYIRIFISPNKVIGIFDCIFGYPLKQNQKNKDIQ